MNRGLRPLAAGAAVLLALLVSACGGGEPPEAGGGQQGGGQGIQPVRGAASAGTITVGSKNFAEQYVLAEIYAQALEAAGFRTRTQLDIGSEQVAYRALRSGRIDAYPEYTGTSLTSFFDVKTEDVPKDPQAAYQRAKQEYQQVGITALPPTPFENTYRLGALAETAQRLGIKKTSDLAPKSGDLTVTAYPECAQRDDCLLGVRRVYGLDFKDVVESETPYEVLDQKEADIAFLFTTDAQLTQPKYVIFDDDRRFFPPYNVSLGVREEVAKRMGPEGAKVIEQVQRPLDERVMRELNSRVVLDKEEPDKVAAAYLREAGFVR